MILYNLRSESFKFVHLLKYGLAILGPLPFSLILESACQELPTATKKTCWDFDWDYIEAIGQFGKN